MGNTVPPRASRDATGSGRRGAGTGRRRRSENVAVVTDRVVATARKQGRDDDDDDDDVEEGTSPRAGRPLLREGGAAPGAPGGKVLTVKMVMRRKDAEALVARLRARSARQRKARMAELKGELRAGTDSCGGGGGASRDARRPTLPPIKENRSERITPVV